MSLAMNNGVSVVITPLIGVHDQVTKLKVYGSPVCYVTSTLQLEERDDSVFQEFTRPNPKYKMHRSLKSTIH